MAFVLFLITGIISALIISPLAWPLTNWLLRRTRGVDVTGTIANLPEG